MAGFREVLQFVLETDASKAVKGFESTEKSAKGLGSTLTKVGAASAAAGIAVGAGLYGTVKAFEKSEAAANKFQTAVSGMGSKIDTKAIQRLAFDLQQVSTVTDDQVVAAARWGAVYGLTTRQLEELLRASVDLSAQTGKSLDVTTKALAKAASGGGFTALTKMGLTFDETAYKADAFGTTVSESMAFAGGAAAKSADTMTGQLTRLGNNWTDVKEQIGAGANEVFEPIARAAANLSEKVAAANPELLRTVGHFTAIGSVAATAFGGLATVGGQIANLREGFAGASGVLDKFNISLSKTGADGEKSLTGLGKAATGVGAAMAALAAGDIAAGIGNAVTNTADRYVDGINRMLAASGKGQSGLKAWGETAKASHLSVMGSFTDLGQVMTENEVNIGGVVTSWRKADAAFDETAKKSPAAARARLTELETFSEGLDHNSKKYANNQRFIDEHRKSLDLSAKAQEATAKSTKTAAMSTEDWSKALKEVNGPMALYTIHAGDAAAAATGFSTALEAQDTDEQVTSALNLGAALHGVGETVKNLPGTFDAAKAATGGYNEEQTKAITAVTNWGDAAKSQIQTLIESKASNEQVAASAGVYRDSLTTVMKQAGLTDKQIQTYLTTLGLTPEQVNTAITVSKDEEAKFKLQLYANDLKKLPPNVATWVQALIDGGHYAKAWDAMHSYEKGVDAPVKPYILPSAAATARAQVNSILNWGGPTKSAPVTGAPVPVGITPMATTAPIPVAIQAPQVTINLPAGTTPATTLSAIRRYQRLGGDMGGLLDTVAAIR